MEIVGREAIAVSPPVSAPADAPARDSDSDSALVAAVRRGDDRAFEQLYTRYQRRISAYVVSMVKDHGRAEDITQEVFISALRRMRETDRAIAFKPWIYEIAKNACIDQFRRSRRAQEVSFDADEVRPSDEDRLVASQPTPDAAVDAKQQLNHLRGAFDGLSDAHHEILVLREFEGLSYHEIGDRMGLSRPGVESTLFRARKRLTEEYDDLVSGERCLRVQSIIMAVADNATVGTRDSRRLARHLAHCQACRRHAVAAGLDAATLARRPLRKRVAEKIGSILPLPGFIRSRLLPAGDHLATMGEPGWSKVAAVAATLLVVGVGTGANPRNGDTKPDAPAHSQPATVRSSTVPTGHARARALGAAAQPTSVTTTNTGRRRDAAKKRSSSGGSAPGASTPSGGSQTSPTSAQPGGAGTNPSSGSQKPSVPASKLPAATRPVTDPVDTAVQGTGEAVNNAVGGLGGAVGGAGGAVGGAVDGAGGAVGGAVGGAGGAVGGTVDGAGGAVGGAGGAVGGAVGDAGSAVGGTVDDAGDAVGGTIGGAGGAVGGATGVVGVTDAAAGGVEDVTGRPAPLGG
jgi:RNA polymerase sigma factor (sigma-70 family)